MTNLSLLYYLPVTITAAPMPCLSHAKFTDRSPRGSDDYYNTTLRDALSSSSGFSEASEAYSELCGRPNICDALRLAKTYRETRNQVVEKEGVRCEISLEGELNTEGSSSFRPFSQELPVRVALEGSEQDVERSLRTFMDTIGDPHFVTHGSDYQLADRVLGTYGLRTKRRITGALVGKHIVPAFM